MKDSFPNYVSTRQVKTIKSIYKYVCTLDGKIQLAVAGVSQNGRKKWFPLARKSVSTCKNKVVFQKLDFQFPLTEKKALDKRILF